MGKVPVIKDLQLTTYFQELAADSVYPSAGSSAALTAAHAAALFAMACRVNLRKIREGLPAGKGNNGLPVFWQETLGKAELLLEQTLALAQEDGFAVKDFIEGVPQGAERATTIPLQIARCAGEIIILTRDALPNLVPVQADVMCPLFGSREQQAALTVARYNLPCLIRTKEVMPTDPKLDQDGARP